jgi:hypothetical protein
MKILKFSLWSNISVSLRWLRLSMDMLTYSLSWRQNSHKDVIRYTIRIGTIYLLSTLYSTSQSSIARHLSMTPQTSGETHNSLKFRNVPNPFEAFRALSGNIHASVSNSLSSAISLNPFATSQFLPEHPVPDSNPPRKDRAVSLGFDLEWRYIKGLSESENIRRNA